MSKQEKTTKIRTNRGVIMADKKINDLVYIMLLINSNFNKSEKHRYIYKKNIKATKWGRELGITRQTVNNAIKYMVDSEFIKETEEAYLLPIADKHYSDIDIDLLKFLVDVAHKDTIRVYLMLIGYYHNFKSKGLVYNFSPTSIGQELGLSATKKEERDKIRNILASLETWGLIKVSEEPIKVKTKEGNMTEKFELLEATDKLPQEIAKNRNKYNRQPKAKK